MFIRLTELMSDDPVLFSSYFIDMIQIDSEGHCVVVCEEERITVKERIEEIEKLLKGDY